MGSLAPSWDSSAPGVAPKGFADYKEPCSPRAAHKTCSQFGIEERRPSGDLDRKASGPPNLSRASAPPMHGALAVKRYLERASSGSSAPVSPRVGTPRTPHKLTLKVGDEELNGQPFGAKERWCTRVESAKMNERPDEADDSAWRHGSFKVCDASHSMHIPASPTAAVAAADAPFTPLAAALHMPAPHPRVVAARVIPEGDEAMESLDSAEL